MMGSMASHEASPLCFWSDLGIGATILVLAQCKTYSIAIGGVQIYTGDMGTQTEVGHLFSAHVMGRCFGQELLHSTVNHIQVRAFF